MEGEELMTGGVSDGGDDVSFENGLELEYMENGVVQGDSAEGVNGNLADEFLENFEEYWDGISDRLMISRVVSESLIKGMVSAVEQEAAESIAAKELEVASLNERLKSHEACTGKCEDMPLVKKENEVSCSTDSCKKHENIREDLNALRNLAKEQFKKVSKEIEIARGSNSLIKIGSNSELVGLGGILHEKQPESWMHVEKMLDSLKMTMDTACRKVDDLLLSSDVSSCESRQSLGSLATVEDAGVQTENDSHQDEFEERALDPNAQFCGIQNMSWLEKFNDISSLGTKLDAILKSLSMSETELVSHGSHDFDRLHQKAFDTHDNGDNGTVDASIIHVAESYDFHQLKHMNNKELVDYFNDIITKIKRDHESALHQRTEEYFRLKREFLKEKGYSMTHRKDEEFDVLRKKIPKVISKLEDFLTENEKFPELANNLGSIGKLKHRLDILLSENCDLRDSLIEKENEVKILEMQVSHAPAEHSVAEESMLKLVKNLNSAVEDSHIQASLSEEVYKCALTEQIGETRCDSTIELLMTQEVYNTILREAAAAIASETSNRYGIDDERRIWLETKILEKEEDLRLEVEEKEILKQELLSLRVTVEQKEKLAMDLSVQLSKVREQYELVSQELISLKEHECQLLTLVTEANKDLDSLRSQHLEALEQIKVLNQQLDQTKMLFAEANTEKEKTLSLVQQTQDKLLISEAREQTLRKEVDMAANRFSKVCEDLEVLNQQLDQTKAVSAEANKERDKAVSLLQHMHNKLLLSETREQTLRKDMEMAANGISKIYQDFDCRVSGAIENHSLRLEATSSNVKALSKMATLLRKTGLKYKSKLERKCTDLQMAESEVDLLGDEVDALLKLLENIYTTLDHYSPVLKHYPGIIEILKLVRRELTGESTLQADQLHGKVQRKFPRSQIY